MYNPVTTFQLLPIDVLYYLGNSLIKIPSSQLSTVDQKALFLDFQSVKDGSPCIH